MNSMTSDKQKIIIGLVGRKGSGKGTVAKLLKERHDASVYRFSDPLRDILTRLSLPMDREHLVRTSEMIRREFGEDIITRALVSTMQRDPSPLIVLDGVRRVEELEGLHSVGGMFHLVSVQATLDARYARSANRGENADEIRMTRETFEKTENDSPEVSIPAVEARATHIITNNGTLEELIEQIDEMMKKI